MDDDIQVYPNPAQDVLWIETFNEDSRFHFKLHNLNGQQVLDLKLNGATRNSVDISKLSNGVYYFYGISNGKRMTNQKLIISK